jgi:hypothetical protein
MSYPIGAPMNGGQPGMPVIMAPNGQAGMPMNGQMAPMGGQPGAPMGQTSNMVAYYAQMGGAGQPVMM